MLRKRLTSDKHGTTCPNTHHPGVAEGPCSWSPPLRRRQDRAGPRTVAPGPNGRLVHSREKYARRRRRSGPVGGLSGEPVSRIGRSWRGRIGGAGSASRREGRRGEAGSAGPLGRRTGRPNQPGGRPAAAAPWGLRSLNRCRTSGAPSVHELLSGPASHPATPRRPGDRGGHRLPRRARPAHHRAPVRGRAGGRAAGAGRPVASPGRGAVLTHPGGRGARRAGRLRASGARTRAQPAGAGGGPGGVLGEAAGGAARGPGRAAAGHRSARTGPGPLHGILGGGAALTLGARHVG